MKHYYIILLVIIAFYSCKLFENESKSKDIYGCMDSIATNYNPEATIDDGNCDYCREGASFLLISKDNGINWSLFCLSDSIGKATDISVIDSNNIWICTSANIFIPKAQILHTSDGGKHWEEQFVDNNGVGFFNYIEMFDLNNGVALADDFNTMIPKFLKTTDGGNNWIQTTTTPIGLSGNIWRRVDFVNINTGYFFESGVNPQKLLKTENSGITWTNTNFDGYAYVLKFFNENLGFVAGRDGIQRTFDGGATWDSIESINTTWAADIEFDHNDPSKVWLLSDSLYFSNDTGSTWTGCFECNDNGFDAISYSNSYLWVFNGKRYLIKVDASDCNNYIEYQLPEYSYGNMNLGYDFDVDVDVDVIVIAGSF